MEDPWDLNALRSKKGKENKRRKMSSLKIVEKMHKKRMEKMRLRMIIVMVQSKTTNSLLANYNLFELFW